MSPFHVFFNITGLCYDSLCIFWLDFAICLQCSRFNTCLMLYFYLCEVSTHLSYFYWMCVWWRMNNLQSPEFDCGLIHNFPCGLIQDVINWRLNCGLHFDTSWMLLVQEPVGGALLLSRCLYKCVFCFILFVLYSTTHRTNVKM